MSKFERRQLHPRDARVVANWRLGDAEALLRTHDAERANGAIYLGGIAVECLLKASLLEKYTWLQNPPAGLSTVNAKLWDLCYRFHELDRILAELPEVMARLAAREQRRSSRLSQRLKSICARWTISVRYSPRQASWEEAWEFVESVKELKPWLSRM